MPITETVSLVRPNDLWGILSGPVLLSGNWPGSWLGSSDADSAKPAPTSPAVCMKLRRSGERDEAVDVSALGSVVGFMADSLFFLTPHPSSLIPAQGPPASLNISSTSFCLGSSGKPCAKRACGLSNFSDVLYGSKRPSSASLEQRSRRACISSGVIG